MPIQGFVDDSGGKGQGGNFVLAGLLAPAERWAAFSDDWKICLQETPSIAYFKLGEATALKGQFHKFSRVGRDEKLRSLARVINTYAQIAVFSVVDLGAHAQSWGRTADKPLKEVYFWPFHDMILASCFELWDRGHRERFEMLFDEQVVFGPRAKAWYPVVRDVLGKREPGPHLIMPVDPMFRSDDDFLPLQAADLLAGCCRLRTGGDQQFDWLLGEELSSIETSDYSQYYDLERLQSVSSEADELLRSGHTMPELVERYRELFERKAR